MVGNIPHSLELGDSLQQCLFNTLLQRDVCHATALAPTTKAQHGNILFSHLFQTDFATMRSERWIDFVVQHIVDSIFNGAVVPDPGQLGVGGLDGQLATHAVLGIVHQRIFQKGQTALFKPCLQFRIFLHLVIAFDIFRTAIGYAGFGTGRPWLANEHADAQHVVALLAQQLSQIGLGSISDRQFQFSDSIRHGGLHFLPGRTEAVVEQHNCGGNPDCCRVIDTDLNNPTSFWYTSQIYHKCNPDYYTRV